MQRKNEAEHFQFNASVNYFFLNKSLASQYTLRLSIYLCGQVSIKKAVFILAIGEGGAIMLATMTRDSDTLVLALTT